jgi:predicted ATPase
MEDGPNLWKNAEKPRCRGEVLLMLPEPDWAGAEACFRQAIEIARAQGARWWELRAAASLARLLRDQGKARRSAPPARPVYGWFTEGVDLPDLREAGALLEALGAPRRRVEDPAP